MSRLQREGIRSFVNIPLVADSALIGTLNLGAERVAAFSAEHVEIAQEVANSLAVAIRHAQLNRQIERHAAELEQRVAERTAELSDANAQLTGKRRPAGECLPVGHGRHRRDRSASQDRHLQPGGRARVRLCCLRGHFSID